MDVLIILLPLSVALAGVFVALFVRAVHDGQFEDLDDAARRPLEGE